MDAKKPRLSGAGQAASRGVLSTGAHPAPCLHYAQYPLNAHNTIKGRHCQLDHHRARLPLCPKDHFTL